MSLLDPLVRKKLIKTKTHEAIVICSLIIITFLVIYYRVWNINILNLQFHSVYQEVENKNYFLNAQRIQKMGVLIETPECKIPNFKAWDPALIKFQTHVKPIKCYKRSKIRSYMDGSILVLNKTRLRKRKSSVSCCYKVITRKEQHKDYYTDNADNFIEHSECFPILQERTQIEDQFIVVECHKSNSTNNSYVSFHSSPSLIKSKNVERKVQFWEKESKNNIPPSILIIGLDSTSRLQFRRRMLKTRSLLKKLEATEIKGYVKIGENTFPNMCPVLTGYTEEDLARICHLNTDMKFDDCPFIWKRLEAANYLTGFIEDWPKTSSFNYLKTGFVEQPVDFYSRPLFLSSDVHYKVPTEEDAKYHYCAGSVTNDQLIMNYLEGILEFSFKRSTPIFSFSWSTTASHDDEEMLERSDEHYANFLSRILDKGYLNNTVLIVMSDHGYRYGKYKQTLPGFYEDKLPLLWIRLPPIIKQKFPDWQKYLESNKRKLSTPFTLYWTLNLIIDVFSPNDVDHADSIDNKTGQVIPRKHRQNFFYPLGRSNSCEKLGVPDEYCPCFPIKTVKLNDALLNEAAKFAIKHINREIKLQNNSQDCSDLELWKIKSGAMIDKAFTSNRIKKRKYVVGYITEPGGFNFESEVDYLYTEPNKIGYFNGTPTYQRTEKINKNYTTCVTNANLMSICFCNY